MMCPEGACRMPWTEEFLDGCFTAAFRNGALRKHREKLLTDAEKARLPEFQERARRYKIALAEDERLSTEFAENMKEYNEDPAVIKLKQLTNIYYEKQNHLWKIGKASSEYSVVSKESQEVLNKITYYKEIYRKHINELNERICKNARKKNIAPYVRDMVSGYGGVLFWTNEKYIGVGNILYGEDSGWIAPRGAGAPQPKKEAIRISRGCPAEGCRGFLSTSFNCGVCEAKVCEHCHEIIGAKGDTVRQVGVMEVEIVSAEAVPKRHICDADAVETAKMLAKETRPCPTCKTLISKIDGCDQMWCTQCQTAFSWKTGQKEAGRVHNPHYYEWLRRTKGAEGVPREVGDAPGGGADMCCGQDTELLALPWLIRYGFGRGGNANDPTRDVSRFMRDVHKKHVENVKSFVAEIHRKLEDTIAYQHLTTINPQTDQPHLENLAIINVQFLAGDIDEVGWARRIYLEKRNILLRAAMQELKQMYIAAGRDIINSFVRGDGSIGAGVTCRQLGELTLYVHGEIERTNKRFNYSGFDFSPMLTLNNVSGAQGLLGIADDASRRHITPSELKRYLDIVSPLAGGGAVAAQGSAAGGLSAESHEAQKPEKKKRAAKAKPSPEPAASCATE